MRAVHVGEGRLTVAEAPVPEPSEGEVRVRVHGAGLNRADLLQRAGLYPAPPGSPAAIPGLEFAGVVDALGAGADGVAMGAPVFGIAGGGAQAEYLCVPAGQCTSVPEEVDLVAMGGVPEAFVTAHDALVTRAALATGETVCIHAVGSGVGTAGLQLAHALGARVVGTARTPAKLERCAALGLDRGVVPVAGPDGLDVAATAAAIRDVAPGGVDVALELLGGAYVEVDVEIAATKGRIVLVGTLAGGSARLSVLGAMQKRLSIHGTVLRSRSAPEKAEATAAFARDVVPLLASGAVAPVIETVVPIDRADEAYGLLASDTTFGKVVLDCR